jgi:predicted DNA binding protein
VTLWEISFRSRYDYPFIDLSRQFPDTPISMWCLWDKELLQVPTRDTRTLDGIEKGIRKAGHVIEEWVDAGQGRIFLLNCTCEKYRSIWTIEEEHECLDAPPAVYRDGWGYFRMLSLNDSRTRALFQDMNRAGPTELIRKRELPLNSLPTNIWVHGLFSELTPKQRDAMLQAHRYGYYASPRQIKTENIAKGLGLSRSTYEEHLRKAENRILTALIPYLELYSTASPTPKGLPLPRTETTPVAAGS